VFVSPEHLENIYLQSTFVESLWIHAQSEDDFVVCICIPRRGEGESFSEVEILESFRRLAQENGLMKHEIPRNLFIERNANWSAQTGELTGKSGGGKFLFCLMRGKSVNEAESKRIA
jgi:long-subunit acyl-CoA synthetase (AMP-forming)